MGGTVEGTACVVTTMLYATLLGLRMQPDGHTPATSSVDTASIVAIAAVTAAENMGMGEGEGGDMSADTDSGAERLLGRLVNMLLRRRLQKNGRDADADTDATYVPDGSLEASAAIVALSLGSLAPLLVMSATTTLSLISPPLPGAGTGAGANRKPGRGSRLYVWVPWLALTVAWMGVIVLVACAVAVLVISSGDDSGEADYRSDPQLPHQPPYQPPITIPTPTLTPTPNTQHL